jgi:hypothetical protein
MSSEAVRQILKNIEDEVTSRPSAIEFEMAYQSRVAIDRIKFAIKHTEQFGPRTDQSREAGLQLLDALQRLETVDRRFQERSRIATGSGQIETTRAHAVVNGTGRSSCHEPAKSV